MMPATIKKKAIPRYANTTLPITPIYIKYKVSITPSTANMYPSVLPE